MSDNADDSSMSDDNQSLASNDSFNEMSKKFECKDCERNFSTRYNLKRHIESFHDEDSDIMEEEDSDIMEEEDSDIMEDDNNVSEEDMSNVESSTDEDMSDTESSSKEDRSESETSEEEAEEEEEEENIPQIFLGVVNKVIEMHEDDLTPVFDDYVQNGMAENEATQHAFLESDAAKKTLRLLFTETILNINEQRKHPLFKAIMAKANELMNDGFDEREAVTSAVAYRKHAIYNLVQLLKKQ